MSRGVAGPGADAPVRKRARVDAERSEHSGSAGDQARGDEAPVQDAEYWAQVANEADAPDNVAGHRDLYLDTVRRRRWEKRADLVQVNRRLLDFDFEKLCSVTLSNVNIYACLVCGRYFQGRGKSTPAYRHSIDEGHRVFMNLETAGVYVLPDNYQVNDPALLDIQRQLSLTYSEPQIARLDAPDAHEALDLDAKPYLPGFVGLNNIGANDYMNVVIQALAHVPPLRNFFLRGGVPPTERAGAGSGGPPSVTEAAGRLVHSTELVRRFATLVRKLWNPGGFKGQVSPHELLQEVASASQGRFRLTEQADPVDFLGWLLNRLHADLAGGVSAARKRRTIITQCFQGQLRVESQRVIVRSGIEDEAVVDKLDHDGRRAGGQEDEHGRAKFNIDQEIRVDHPPFLMLALDLPPPPVFQDVVKQNIIPQIPLAHVLAKYDGTTIQEANGMIRRFKLTKLPPYIILHFRRFTKNRFVEERNPTIVNFPTVGLDLAEYLEAPADGPTLGTVYNLLANVTHEATAGTVRDNSVWRSQVHTRTDGERVSDEDVRREERWFQMQDLLVDEVNKQMLFLGESYIQVRPARGRLG